MNSIGGIVFVRNNDLYQYNTQTRKAQLLLKNGSSPSCYRDGKSLAFIRKGNIWLVNLENMNETKITSYTDSAKRIKSIEWFPQGNKLMFSREDNYELSYLGDKRAIVWPDNSYEDSKTKLFIRNIWITSLDGKSLKKWIGNVPGSGTTGTKLSDVDAPKWSPDGTLLLFSRNGDIWIANISTDASPCDKDEKRLATVAYLENHYGASGNSHFADHFSWAPDGKKLIYDIHRHAGSGFGEIWEMSSDGSERKRLWVPNEESFPQVSPDGSQIAFIQNFDLWIMEKNTTTVHKVVDNVDRDTMTWCLQK